MALCVALAQAQSQSLVEILSRELSRNFKVLKEKADPPPYFLSYSVVESDAEILSATLGSLNRSNETARRILDVSVRVGSPEFDNYHVVSSEFPRFGGGAVFPLEDQPGALDHILWRETDRVYKAASRRLIQLQSSSQSHSANKAPDFSPAPAVVDSRPPARVKPLGDEWAARVRRLSRLFERYPSILSSEVTVTQEREVKTFVNTEGTRIQHGRTWARVAVVVRAKASDGQDLFNIESFDAEDAARLPKEEQLAAAFKKTADQLTAMLLAPDADPYVGPAILSGRAAAVFFHEIFGHRVEGQRLKAAGDGQTFLSRLNQPVLPPFLSVTFDPTRLALGTTSLAGAYLYDDEGVSARAVPVVEKGTLKTFLMTRSPLEQIPSTNGHARKEAGREVTSRQSNLIVDSAKTVTEVELGKMLVAEIVRQGKPYGLLFDVVTGGFTNTARGGPQAFNVLPIVVYRIYPDGRPPELVKGVDIVGTPLSSFSKILATADRQEVFNGVCGAESGSVPVAAASPALLVSEIEVQRKPKPTDRPPLLPRPTLNGGGF
jgi:TldD protein